MLHELAMTDVNGEATTLAVGEYIRESIDQAEKTLLDYKGRRSVAEKWVDFVDNSKWLSSFLIDAKHVSPPCEVPGLIFIISAVLRGFGQVVFQDNPWTGLFVCIAGGLPHWPTAIMGIIGCTITTVFPLLVQPLEPRGLVASGIYGFNGVLLGWGYSTFDNNIQRAHSSILHVVISRSFTRATRIPPLTWPYNIALLMWMACATLSNNYDTLFTHAVTPKALAGEYSITWFFTTWLKGISQVVFSADLWSGVVLLVGILVGCFLMEGQL
ncbi:Urea transporter, putative [Perkinsus marinus ATCC 50983]|uniref:Urea transporter, putative n=1 Tax=Perkinsus marinus (strain ATCC 50983 / TXsc) TaxID=423536 RepID=C5KX50_PERM5|nr:Urea transporter, putative [Perkinsus marinus ATCC 50983]EER10906.1 Urea transporter, putative [Perkinsus marinus ATCC 50983]|eukprot:XP_002779111.1 Urea transporter, putative [Perkinsus marinus ATCC 50983]